MLLSGTHKQMFSTRTQKEKVASYFYHAIAKNPNTVNSVPESRAP